MRLDVARDRGHRRPQLVRDAHQEVALQLVHLAQPVDHALEPLRQLPQLVVAGVGPTTLTSRSPCATRSAAAPIRFSGRVIRREKNAARKKATSRPSAGAGGHAAGDVRPGVVDVGQRLGEHDRARLTRAKPGSWRTRAPRRR